VRRCKRKGEGRNRKTVPLVLVLDDKEDVVTITTAMNGAMAFGLKHGTKRFQSGSLSLRQGYSRDVNVMYLCLTPERKGHILSMDIFFWHERKWRHDQTLISPLSVKIPIKGKKQRITRTWDEF